MLFKNFLLIAVATAVSANIVQTRPCPGGWPEPNWFESSDCSGSTCSLQRGQIFSGRAEITLQGPFNILEVGIEATLLGIPFDLPIPEGYSNACDFLEGGATCPVAEGQTVVWALQFPITSTLPLVRGLTIRRKHFYSKIELQ